MKNNDNKSGNTDKEISDNNSIENEEENINRNRKLLSVLKKPENNETITIKNSSRERKIEIIKSNSENIIIKKVNKIL